MGAGFATSIELTVLRLLIDAPCGMYGLELVKASGGSLKRGTVYVTLNRMEEKGLVKPHTQHENHPGLPRSVYRITALGSHVLAAAELLGLAAQAR